MSKRNLANIDADMFSPIGRLLQQGFAHGLDCDIVQGGLESGQTALQSIYAQAAVQNCAIGSKLVEKESGREFIYTQAGSVNLSKALMTISLPPVSNYLDIAQTAYGWAVGDSSGNVLITTGATPATDYFKDGWLVVNKGTGLGQCYPILSSSSHATIVAVVLKSGHVVITAWPEASEVSLVKNVFRDVIVAPVTTLTATPAGVPIIDVTATYFYWNQVKGPCAMTVDTGDSLTIGEPVGAAGTNAVAGAVGVASTLEGHYGRAMTLATGDETCLVNLDLGL